MKFELGETFDSIGRANDQLFDYIEVFYNQQRHSTLDYVSRRGTSANKTQDFSWQRKQTVYGSGSSSSTSADR